MRRIPGWALGLLAAFTGAVLMIALGQLLALLGGNCSLLCRNEIAVPYGAGAGLLAVYLARRG